jgi:putative transposase
MKNRKRNRKLGYDYSQDNLYFVTICVKDKMCCFGDVMIYNSNDCFQKEMILNEFGKIVEKQWLWLEEQYPYVKLHSFVVMPNHVHGILEIDSFRDGLRPVPKGIKIKSLSQLIGAFKTTSSKWIHLAGFDNFSWQRSFHDHIIRNDISYEKISDYIDSNPQRWDTDVFFEKIKIIPIV